MKPDLAWMSQPFAHRGLHDPANGIIENTRSAFVAAMDHGYGFETYYHLEEDATSLSHDSVWTLLSDTQGRLWVGTDAGLNLFNEASKSSRLTTG